MPHGRPQLRKAKSFEALCRQHGLDRGPRSIKRGAIYRQTVRGMGGHEALLDSNLVFQLLVYSLGISGFELDPHCCQLPVVEEVQPDRNSCPAVLTVQ